MLERMRIGQRVALLAACLLLFVGMVGGVGWYAFRVVDANLEDLLAGDVAFSQQMHRVEASLLSVRQYEKDIFLSIGNPADAEKNLQSSKQKFDKHVTELAALLQASKSQPRAAGRQAEFDVLQGKLEVYRKGMDALFARIVSGEIAAANMADAAIMPFKSELYALRDQIENMNQQANADIESADQRQEAMLAQMRNLLLVAVLAALLSGALLSILIARSITRPLSLLQARMRHTAENNDLTRGAQVTGKDEVSETARALTDLLGNLAAFIERTREDSQRVSATSHAMSQVASRITEASRAQADASSSTAAVVEQMTSGISRVAEHASQMADEARSSMEMSVQGSQVAGQAAGEMSEIAQVIQASERSIATLSQRSSEIGSIVGVIREIAEQTNLLALNAAIEAARAGESGRGFAVVADEVRKLAERTAQATNEISSKISQVQGETQTAVASMQQAAGRMSSGVELSQAVAKTLENIRSLSAQVLGKTDEIAAAMREQSHASREAAGNVERIAEMSSSNNQAVVESAAMAGELSKLSSELDLEIGRFRT
ncbi:methyl-accepting chemotaxis protein [Craterilacuibacter sp. RT1T]|uniref:methyl-accepting chemotaxis protein n=1 Tax=Craterilacuibacter sp. RT1T TaxID=2942211 RepID=UPI0020C0737F|nr:methyl-accepting chemotaxis protein [Craterilacuibacter sp. RT1T]MCL6263361.1 methyl-accepting chemotaxis protein [Craterilacuibacter sp. RT1T]